MSNLPLPPCPPRPRLSSEFSAAENALIQYAAILDRLDWWQSMAERLLEYADHDTDCWHTLDYCSCGLSALRSAIASAGKEKV